MTNPNMPLTLEQVQKLIAAREPSNGFVSAALAISTRMVRAKDTIIRVFCERYGVDLPSNAQASELRKLLIGRVELVVQTYAVGTRKAGENEWIIEEAWCIDSRPDQDPNPENRTEPIVQLVLRNEAGRIAYSVRIGDSKGTPEQYKHLEAE